MVKQHQSCGSLKPKFKEEANLEHWQPQLTNVEAALKLEEVVFAKSKTVLVVRFEWFQ